MPVTAMVPDASKTLGVAQPAQFVEVDVTCSYSPKMHTPASVPSPALALVSWHT